jgi:Fe-S-cluster containining protein
MELKKSRLDLDKCGLAELKTKDVRLWTDSDYENLVNAFKTQNMAPQLPIPFNPPNIKRLLSKSHCRQCGLCCEPNPEFPSEPGVIVFDNELKLINKLHEFSWKQLKKKTVRHESDTNARYIPFPCSFHIKNKCLVHEAKPMACRIYPLTNYLFHGKGYTAVNVRCEYGSDIYKAAMSEYAINRSAYP